MNAFLVFFVIPYVINFVLFIILQAVLLRNWNSQEALAGACFSLFSYITTFCLAIMYLITIVELLRNGFCSVHEKKTVQKEFKKKVLKLRGGSRFEMMDFDE